LTIFCVWLMERAQAAANWPGINRNEDLQAPSQDQRWRAIYKAAFDQASGAIHEDDVTRSFTYNRGEAEALIGIAAALLKAAPGPTCLNCRQSPSSPARHTGSAPASTRPSRGHRPLQSVECQATPIWWSSA
jgi:hypothetical protein